VSGGCGSVTVDPESLSHSHFTTNGHGVESPPGLMTRFWLESKTVAVLYVVGCPPCRRSISVHLYPHISVERPCNGFALLSGDTQRTFVMWQCFVLK
jgi:hypothetical protein